MLAAPFVQMLTMYDYGCEKRYGKPVSRATMTTEKMREQKRKIAEAEARLGRG